MCNYRYVKIIVVLVLAHVVAAAHSARGSSFVPIFTQDATQPFPNSQDNFEEVLSGNVTSQFTGQFLNAFSAPSSVAVNFDPSSNTTIVHFAGAAIAQNPGTYFTFGYAINAVSSVPGGPTVNPGNQDGYWTPGPGAQPLPGHVPELNCAAQYMPASHQALITISNDPGTVSLSGVGYLVTNTPFALTSLNRTALPPGAFVASGIADGTVLSAGMSTSYTISGINPGEYVTVFSDAQWSGASSGNPYSGSSGEWLEFQAVPEPASWVMMFIGTAAFVLADRCRFSARLLRSMYSRPPK